MVIRSIGHQVNWSYDPLVIWSPHGGHMFVMPKSYPGHTLPALGTHLAYDTVTDESTGWPRAENVQFQQQQQQDPWHLGNSVDP